MYLQEMASTSNSKLELCEVCAAENAKYTCPKCEVRTCGLQCVNIHKKELSCDGIRDKTKFIPLNAFTDLDLQSDYRLLEEIGRSVENFRKSKIKKFTRTNNLPLHLTRFRHVAYNKSIHLQFMPQNFSKHKENTSYFNWKTKELFWRVEFIFTQAENAKWIFEKVLDNTRLSVLVEEIFNPNEKSELNNNKSFNELLLLQNTLKYYRAQGLSGLKALLKAERVKKSDSRFYELDFTLSLDENLKNKNIIEFPVIYIILKDHCDMFEIIDSDDEDVKPKSKKASNNRTGNWKNERNNTNQCSQMLNDKNQDSSKKKINTSVNYFFNSDISDSEDEENSTKNCDQNKYKELYIPNYDDLVKMEH